MKTTKNKNRKTIFFKVSTALFSSGVFCKKNEILDTQKTPPQGDFMNLMIIFVYPCDKLRKLSSLLSDTLKRGGQKLMGMNFRSLN